MKENISKLVKDRGRMLNDSNKTLESLFNIIFSSKDNIAVEYNGEQHYIPIEHFGGMIGFENTVKRDEIKRKKCSENGCKLFEIEYNYTEEDFIQLCENIQSIIERRENK